MFSLLVKYDDWSPEGADTIDISRVLEYTEDSIERRFRVSDQVDFDALRELPALLMPETPGKPGNEQLARVAQITGTRQIGDAVHISYTFDATIPPLANHTAIEVLTAAGAMWRLEHSRTHWAVEDIDLYACIARALFRRRFEPTVFRLRGELETRQGLVSVMMPFAAEFDEIYDVIKNAVTSAGLQCLRADDIWTSESIMQDVVNLIVGSEAVIADCTGQNPNVFYEMGVAHTIGRPVIPIVQDGRDIPFDISHLRYIRYHSNQQGLEILGSEIVTRLRSLEVA